MNDFNFEPQNNDPIFPLKVGHAKGYSIAALILGISALFFACICCCLYYLAIVLAVISIVFVFLARKDNGGKFTGMAIAGFVLAIIAIVIFMLWVGLEVFVSSMSEDELIRMIEKMTGMPYEEFMAEAESAGGTQFNFSIN
jgi:hypothetical protein